RAVGLAARATPRARRLPRPPSLSAGPGRAAAGPPGRPAAGVHVPHPLREVRPLRAGPAAAGGGGRHPAQFVLCRGGRRRHRPHADLPVCYQAADVFLFASETETQGLVLAEAAACGIPVVSVTGPGCDEVVRDGETGLLTKAEPPALAEAAISLLVDGQRRRRM